MRGRRRASPRIDCTPRSAESEATTLVPTLPVAPVTTTRMSDLTAGDGVGCMIAPGAHRHASRVDRRRFTGDRLARSRPVRARVDLGEFRAEEKDERRVIDPE